MPKVPSTTANACRESLLAIVRDDEVCRRLMTVPGVGPVVALTWFVPNIARASDLRFAN
jgi:transposase